MVAAAAAAAAYILQEANLALQSVLLQGLQDALEVLDVHHKQLSLLRAATCGSTLSMTLQSKQSYDIAIDTDAIDE